MNSGLYARAGASATATAAAWLNRFEAPITKVSNRYFSLSRLCAARRPGRGGAELRTARRPARPAGLPMCGSSAARAAANPSRVRPAGSTGATRGTVGRPGAGTDSPLEPAESAATALSIGSGAAPSGRRWCPPFTGAGTGGSGTSVPPDDASTSTTTARFTAKPRWRPSASLIGRRRIRSIASLANSLGAASSAVSSMRPSGRVRRRNARCWAESAGAPDPAEVPERSVITRFHTYDQVTGLVDHVRPPR